MRLKFAWLLLIVFATWGVVVAQFECGETKPVRIRRDILPLRAGNATMFRQKLLLIRRRDFIEGAAKKKQCFAKYERDRQKLKREHLHTEEVLQRMRELEGVQPLGATFSGAATLIAVYAGHDASITVVKKGRLQCVLELERLFEVRYYDSPIDYGSLRSDWLRALNIVRNQCACDNGECPTHFTNGVFIQSNHASIGAIQIPVIVEEVFPVEHWHVVEHHVAHASIGYHSSPFRSALIVSCDAGGSDGSFNVFVGAGMQIHHLRRFDFNVGFAYNMLASVMSEITGRKPGAQIDPHSLKANVAYLEQQSYAGKLMGYSAVGTPDPELTDLVRQTYELDSSQANFIYGVPLPREALLIKYGSLEDQRALAASVQVAFEQFLSNMVTKLWEVVSSVWNVEGIVMTGGCALNVLTIQLLYDTLAVSLASLHGTRPPLGIHVPPAPNDSGISVGGIWAVAPPYARQPLQYVGFRLWDEADLDFAARDWNASRLSQLGGVEHLAELLAGGPAWLSQANRTSDKPIIAVVRGRQEFGPRALGHRSLLAVPDSDKMRDRMNRLKFREWYRPVAPMIADEALEHVFGREVKSVTMQMAPRVRDEVRIRFPALAHLDGTARHQSVGQGDEPWLHSLLHAVGKRTGLAALINTSFNTRGKPIVNTVHACLEMLSTLEDLDYVLIEDWLFQAPSGRS